MKMTMVDVFQRDPIEGDQTFIRVIESLHQVCNRSLHTRGARRCQTQIPKCENFMYVVKTQYLNLFVCHVSMCSQSQINNHTLPPPEGPTRATLAPGFNVRFTPCSHKMSNLLETIILIEQVTWYSHQSGKQVGAVPNNSPEPGAEQPSPQLIFQPCKPCVGNMMEKLDLWCSKPFSSGKMS